MNKRPRFFLLASTLLALLCFDWPAFAAERHTLTDQGVVLEFPDQITFHAQIEPDAAIDQVVLEYGTNQRTCGTVIAKAFPLLEAESGDISWTWDMRQSGSLPPGATIWYRWRITNTDGTSQVTEDQQVTWLDDVHSWESITSGMLTLHWYDGSTAFAQELLDAASASLGQLGSSIGVTPPEPIHLYIYANTDDMREAILYEPGWTGGLAFSDYNLSIIGISPEQLDWGKRTAAHELTHVLVGIRAFSCLGGIPTWLNEGIAVYGEGGPEPYSLTQFNTAIAEDSLLSVRSLSGNFSEDPAQAGLSYTQSYSLVNYLITAYGPEKLLALFDELRNGSQIDPVMQQVYGFGLDGLEVRWRAAIGAQPRRNAEASPTVRPEPSPVPTFQPLGGVPAAGTLSSTPTASAPPTTIAEAPTVSAVEPATQPELSSPVTAQPTSSRSPLVPVLLALVIGVPLAIGAGWAILHLATRSKKSR